MRCSISSTSFGETLSSRATMAISSGVNQVRLFLYFLRLKNSFLCDLVVATFTMRQFLMTYSWMQDLIQWTANETRRTPIPGSKRFTACMRPMFPSCMRSARGSP